MAEKRNKFHPVDINYLYEFVKGGLSAVERDEVREFLKSHPEYHIVLDSLEELHERNGDVFLEQIEELEKAIAFDNIYQLLNPKSNATDSLSVDDIAERTTQSHYSWVKNLFKGPYIIRIAWLVLITFLIGFIVTDNNYNKEVPNLSLILDIEQARINDYQTTIGKQIKELDSKNTQHEVLINKLQLLEDKFDILNQKLEDAEKQLRSPLPFISQVINFIDGNVYIEDIQDLLQQSEALKEYQRSIQEQYISIQTKDLRKLQATINREEVENAELAEELEALNTKLALLSKENSKLMDENSTKAKFIESLSRGIDSMTINLRNKSRVYDALASEAQRKDEELVALKAEFEKNSYDKEHLVAIADSLTVSLLSERAILNHLAENSLEAIYKIKKGQKRLNVILDEFGRHKGKHINRIGIRFHISHSMIQQPNNELVQVEILDDQYRPVSASLQKEIVINDYIGKTYFDFPRRNKLEKGSYYIKVSHNNKRMFFHHFKIS